ncbi:MAG: hypothetical protein FJ054_12945 [Cyanobacteria bacterium M_surface_10_m2_119]|nr:hypothetical protein [Cyanobacteria bacterium M_surface_10_m2_119]
MAVKKIRWYVKAQLGVLLLPVGLCLFGEAVIRKGLEELGKRAELTAAAGAALPVKFLEAPGPWFWYGTFGLILINAGVGLMIESGLLRGYPRQN